MTINSKELVLAAAKRRAMAHGYAGLNFRDLAADVGIKAPSIYHYFPTKADLGAAVAQRYWEDIVRDLETIDSEASSPKAALKQFPNVFRKSLQNENRMCLCSFMSAEFDDLPENVKSEVQKFADVNIAWLSKNLIAAGIETKKESEKRARAIFSAVAGAQLMSRSRADLSLFDSLIQSYRTAGLLA